jgi:hypothetical protein
MKKVHIKQGGYTGLIMEQIRNSQEDNIKTKAPQV